MILEIQKNSKMKNIKAISISIAKLKTSRQRGMFKLINVNFVDLEIELSLMQIRVEDHWQEQLEE